MVSGGAEAPSHSWARQAAAPGAIAGVPTHTGSPTQRQAFKIGSTRLTDLNRSQPRNEPEHRQQPEDHNDDHNHIQDLLDLAVHRQVVIDQPEDQSDTTVTIIVIRGTAFLLSDDLCIG